jgi:hypothetical protein
MSNVKKKIKIRQGHRAYLTKILGNANAIVENYDVSLEKKLKQIRITLNERLDTLKTLDEEADEEISLNMTKHLISKLTRKYLPRSKMQQNIGRMFTK